MSVEAQVALVHGGGIYPTPYGYRLEPGSEARADHAVSLYLAKHVEKLLFSGGNAHGDDLGGVSEACLMADRAVAVRGVSAKDVYVEDRSSSTVGNWANSAAVMRDEGFESVLGVTGRKASVRAEWTGNFLAEVYGLGLEIVRYSPSRETEGLRAVPRELASAVMSRQCLYEAHDQGVELPDLDAFYQAWKARYGLAHAKRILAERRVA